METHERVMSLIISEMNLIGYQIEKIPSFKKLLPHLAEFIVDAFNLKNAKDVEIEFVVEMFTTALKYLKQQQTIYQVVQPEKPKGQC